MAIAAFTCFWTNCNVLDQRGSSDEETQVQRSRHARQEGKQYYFHAMLAVGGFKCMDPILFLKFAPIWIRIREI